MYIQTSTTEFFYIIFLRAYSSFYSLTVHLDTIKVYYSRTNAQVIVLKQIY